MGRELRPAHEVIVDQINVCCKIIKLVDKDIAKGGVGSAGGNIWIPASELILGRSQEIGGLCSLLSVLDDIIIPDDKLLVVIEELKKLDYTHAVILSTIKKLSQRLEAPEPSINTSEISKTDNETPQLS